MAVSTRPWWIQKARDRAHQALEGLAVELVLASEGVHNLGSGLLALGVPGVVRQLAVADRGSVFVPPDDGPQVHHLGPCSIIPCQWLIGRQNVCLGFSAVP